MYWSLYWRRRGLKHSSTTWQWCSYDSPPLVTTETRDVRNSWRQTANIVILFLIAEHYIMKNISMTSPDSLSESGSPEPWLFSLPSFPAAISRVQAGFRKYPRIIAGFHLNTSVRERSGLWIQSTFSTIVQFRQVVAYFIDYDVIDAFSDIVDSRDNSGRLLNVIICSWRGNKPTMSSDSSIAFRLSPPMIIS